MEPRDLSGLRKSRKRREVNSNHYSIHAYYFYYYTKRRTRTQNVSKSNRGIKRCVFAFRFLQSACDTLKQLPVEVQHYLVYNYLNWRDLVVMLACCDYDARGLLTCNELKKVCRRSHSMKGIDWAAEKKLTPQQFIDEYNIVWKRSSKHRHYATSVARFIRESHSSADEDLSDTDSSSSLNSNDDTDSSDGETEFTNSNSGDDSSHSGSSSNYRRKYAIRSTSKGWPYQCVIDLSQSVIALDKFRHPKPSGECDMEQAVFHPDVTVVAYTTLEDGTGESETEKKSILTVRHFGRMPSEWATPILFHGSTLRPYEEESEPHRQAASEDKRLYPEWSPCGNYLSVVERSAPLGRHSISAVTLFHFDKQKGLLRLVQNASIAVDSYSISNRLWVGNGRLILPHPLNNGEPPSVLTLDSATASARLTIPEFTSSSAHRSHIKRKQYQQHPTGLLTGLSTGHSASVRYCAKKFLPLSESIPGRGFLGEHEHQIITIHDQQQKRHFEIAIPGIVIELTSKQNVLCALYRRHLAVTFDVSVPVIMQAGEDRQDHYQRETPFDPFGQTSVNRERLSYRSYPTLSQPWTQELLRPALYRYETSCPLEVANCRLPLDEPLSPLTCPTDSESKSSDDNEAATASNQKRRKVESPIHHSAYCDDRCVDTLDRRFDADSDAAISYETARLFYAEIDVETKEVIFFNGNSLNIYSPWVLFRGPAYEGYDKASSGSDLNKLVLLNKQGHSCAMSVSDVSVHIKRNPLELEQTQGCVLSRIHPKLQPLKDTSMRFGHLDGNHYRGLFAESKRYLATTKQNSVDLLSVQTGSDFKIRSGQLDKPPAPMKYSFTRVIKRS